YFKSKESLCESVLDEVVGDYQRLVESIDDELEPIEQLRELLQAIVELNASGEWVNCKLILRFSTSTFESHPNVERRVKSFWQWQSSVYEELIEKCRQAGQINTDVDVKMQTHLLISSLAGTVMLEKAAPDQASLGELCDTIIKLLQS
ncbi:MAG: TetR/AcrR family transcriptional regulator, partial [Planctomycetota bacterium]